MYDFITTITSFPTVIFTFLMVLMSLYWLLVIIGTMDLDLFGALDDLSADTSVDDIVDAQSGLDNNGGGLSGLLANWGLSGVPVTIVASIMTSLGWLITSVATAVIFPHIDSPYLRFILGLGIMAIAFPIMILLTAKIIRPLRQLFKTRQAQSKSTLVGKHCTVKSLKVTDTFGQGEVSDGEAGIIVDIIANVPNTIKQGDTVLLVEYQKDKDSYHISKLN